MSQISVTAMLTCFNRKNYTIACVTSLVEGNPNISFKFIVTDDNSTDGTKQALEKLPYDIRILSGDGQLFWNGGMIISMGYALKALADNKDSFEYALLVNDDVEFENGCIEKMVDRLNSSGAHAIAGATKDTEGNMSYGCVLKTSSFFAKFEHLMPSVEPVLCDTFNCNCVLIKSDIFMEIGTLDSKYRHSMGDYDYGMSIRRKGYIIINGEDYVGTCCDNTKDNTWRDNSLPRKKRLELKESPKGLPASDWFHFVNKNYGFISAVYHFVTPYIRILIKK